MKVSTEIDNNFGYEKITQLVDNIPLKGKECQHYTQVVNGLKNVNIIDKWLKVKYVNILHKWLKG
jgi:hypothetical protein